MRLAIIEKLRNLAAKVSIRQALWASMAFWLVLGTTLALFRNAKQDETYYIQEAWAIADCLRHGEWIGDEAVGWHGTLFKIPAALIMMVTGPSVFAATLITVLITVASFWLGFRVFRKALASDWWALCGAWLLLANALVIWGLPRFGRDIPAMFAVLVLMEAILYRRNRWVVGCAWLLLFEARECVFFACIPAFCVWVPIDEWLNRGGFQPIKQFVSAAGARWVAGLIPTVAWITLMLCTNIVPANMQALNIIGATGSFQYQLKHFRTDVATESTQDADKLIYQMDVTKWSADRRVQLKTMDGWLANIEAAGHETLDRVGGALNVVLRYLGKFLYPNSLSILTIPKVLAIPALVMSLCLFFKWWRDRRGDLLGVLLIFWSYFLIWFFRASFGRYLLPLYPVMVLCFIWFLKDGLKHQRLAMIAILATVVVTGLGFGFETKNIVVKLGMDMIVVGLLVAALLEFKAGWRYGSVLGKAAALSIGFFGLAAALYGSAFDREGQIRQHLWFGSSLEYARIAKEFRSEEIIWINPTKSHLICSLYRRERPASPERKFRIHSFVPKRAMLAQCEQRTYDFTWCGNEDFYRKVLQSNISTVALLCSDLPQYKFSGQDDLALLQKAGWLKLNRRVPLKNKTLYVFRVIEDSGGTPPRKK